MKLFNKGFNYSQDGPGNRLVYHLQGCNFSCKWCANPEGMGTVCAQTVERSVADICREIESCRPMFFDGGGVTFTGGEATLQFDELAEILAWCQTSNINTAIETNGSHPRFMELVAYIDHIMLDIKHFDKQQHAFWTANDGQATFENFSKLCQTDKNVLIRIPLIRQANCQADGFIDFFKKYDCSHVAFEVLPYHEFGKFKWTQEYAITDGFVTATELAQFKEAFLKNGFKVLST